MPRSATVALTLAFVSVPPVSPRPIAAQASSLTRLGTLWGLPSGSNPTEEFNRNTNLVRRAGIWRAPIQVTLDGKFNPSSGNVILQYGRTYAQAFSIARGR